MRFAVLVLACVLAVANAQQNTGKYTPDNGRYNNNQYSRYNNNQYNRYNNNPYNRYNNQYNNQYNRNNNQYNPFNRNQTPFKPFVTPTPFPRPSVTVTPAPSVVSKLTLEPVVTSVVTPAPIIPVAPVAPVAPVIPVVTAARYATDARSAETVKYGNEINPDGSFSYFYETNNGIAAQAQGEPRNFGGNPAIVPDVFQGSFSWYSPEGQLVAINYVADENGYQPSGDALPQPPPVPDQIARALAYVARTAPVPAVARAN